MVTKTIADQDAKKAKKVFHYRRLRHLANYDSAGILNHFKSDKTNKQDSDSQKKKIVEDFHKKYIVSRILPYKKLKKKLSCQMVNESMYLSELRRQHCLMPTSYL